MGVAPQCGCIRVYHLYMNIFEVESAEGPARYVGVHLVPAETPFCGTGGILLYEHITI